MPTNVKTEARPSYFYVRVEGEFDFVQSMARLPQILNEFAQSKKKQILMDVRGVAGPVSVLERMDYYGNFSKCLRELESQKLLFNPRVAWLVPPHWISTSLGSELVEKAGYEYFRTDESNEIIRWLGLDPKTTELAE